MVRPQWGEPFPISIQSIDVESEIQIFWGNKYKWTESCKIVLAVKIQSWKYQQEWNKWRPGDLS